MKSKYLFGTLAIIILILISGCIQKEKIANNDRDVHELTDEFVNNDKDVSGLTDGKEVQS